MTRMQQLRQATREAHSRIERALPLFQLGLTLPLYTRVVAAFYGFYAPLEPLCQEAAGRTRSALDLATRAKTPLLANDLARLGYTTEAVLALPRCISLPPVASMSAALGVLYVMEGATLGGQIISRHLNDALSLQAHEGVAFFTGYGDQTRDMWKRFAVLMETADGLDIDASITAAVKTFDTLDAWFVERLGSN